MPVVEAKGVVLEQNNRKVPKELRDVDERARIDSRQLTIKVGLRVEHQNKVE